jgi:hypothetical protein
MAAKHEESKMNLPGPTKDERIGVLKQEFAQLPSNRWTNLTRDELFNYLDQKGKRPFDRDVGEQIWDRMMQNDQGESTVDEFIKVFMEAEDILQAKIDNANSYLQSYYVQKDEAIQKLEALRKSEVLSVYGIMENSTLTVTVAEMHNLRVNEITNSCYAVAFLECEDQKFQTTQQPANTPDPVLNESFVFEIKKGVDDLQIRVINADNNELIGRTAVKLNTLRDQQRKEEWYDLIDAEGRLTRSRVRIGLQWIYSRVPPPSHVH